MDKLNIGDKVFCIKQHTIQYTHINKGTIMDIRHTIDPKTGLQIVYFYSIKDESEYHINFGYSYNIFPSSDKIWLDKESQRDDVIDNLIC